MNNRFLLAFAPLLIVLIAACGGKQDAPAHEHSEDTQEWKAMDDFHMVMAETFHPYKDSSNLEPVKSKVNDLVASAEQWMNSSLPEKVNNDDIKGKLQNLKAETEVLRDAVQKGNDQEIGGQLTKVHDMFHEIQEAWYGGNHEHDHEHHH